MKTILVTGGAGFVGSHLCERLHAAGHRVISLDNYFIGSRDNHIDGVEYREGHTKDIERHVPEHLDLIYHLGEYSRVEQSVLEPEVVHDLNIAGTQGVLEFWQKRKCKLLYAGSSTKFGDGGKTRETSPYASSKAQNTEKVRELGEREKLSYAITYFYNVFGPGERAGIYGTVIEAFKQMYLTGMPLTLIAPGTQQRNFTHVDDIVDGLIAVGESGQGDEYGLGNERAYSMLEVAKLFGGEVVMLPARASNRTQSSLDTSKAQTLGWRASRSLEEYIGKFIKEASPQKKREKRVLVFSTTFLPLMGPAEEALLTLMRQLPDIHFDIVTSSLGRGERAELPANVSLYRIGAGNALDKYLLPFLGYRRARSLARMHSYLFSWGLMASYGAFAGALLKRMAGMPLLITLADQGFEHRSPLVRAFLRFIFSNADQVYGIDPKQEREAARFANRNLLRRSLGVGDSFANQLRYAYVDIFLYSKAI